MNYKKVSIILAAALLIVSASFIVLATHVSNFNVPVPVSSTLTRSAFFEITAFAFSSYDPGLNRYASCLVTIANIDTVSSHTCTVTVTLKDGGGNSIADGTISGSIGASTSYQFTVSLTWQVGKSLADFVSGVVVAS